MTPNIMFSYASKYQSVNRPIVHIHTLCTIPPHQAQLQIFMNSDLRFNTQSRQHAQKRFIHNFIVTCPFRLSLFCSLCRTCAPCYYDHNTLSTVLVSLSLFSGSLLLLLIAFYSIQLNSKASCGDYFLACQPNFSLLLARWLSNFVGIQNTEGYLAKRFFSL